MPHKDRQQPVGGDAEEFQSLSPLATISLLLGLLSPVALASPLLVIVPAAAALVALLALAKIRLAEGGLTGAKLAKWGLACGLAGVVAALVRDPIRDTLMRRQARDVAEQWLTQLAEGHVSDALALMSSPALQALGPKPASPDAEPPKAEDVRTLVLEKLRSDKAAMRLVELKRPLRFEASPAPGSWPIFETGRTLLMEDFTASAADGGHACRVQIRLARSQLYEAEGRPWRVDSWQVIDDHSADLSSDSSS